MAFLIDTMAIATDGFIVRGTLVIGQTFDVTVSNQQELDVTVINLPQEIEVIVKDC